MSGRIRPIVAKMSARFGQPWPESCNCGSNSCQIRLHLGKFAELGRPPRGTYHEIENSLGSNKNDNSEDLWASLCRLIRAFAATERRPIFPRIRCEAAPPHGPRLEGPQRAPKAPRCSGCEAIGRTSVQGANKEVEELRRRRRACRNVIRSRGRPATPWARRTTRSKAENTSLLCPTC